jgi:cytochrome P450
MQPASDLPLPHLRIQDPDFAIDPLPHIEAARREHPWLAKCDYGYLVHEYQAIKDLNVMDDRMRPSMDSITEIMGAKGTPWGDFMDNLMLAKSPPEHTRLRRSVVPSFTPRAINRFRPLMREVISRQLDEWAPQGAFDFAKFAANFPITVMFGLIGASADALPSIRKSLETQGLSVSLDKSLTPQLQDAFTVLWKFVDGLIIERQQQGSQQDDVLNALLISHAAGEMDAAELRNLLIFLFAAGYDTSKNMLTLIMHKMLEYPDYWERCASDRVFSDKVVEEVFRYNSVSNLYRTTTREMAYRDVVFPADTVLILALTLSGRDPKAFADASAFKPERKEINHHLAFGRGIHMCLGQHLARAQIQEGIQLVAQRLKNPRLAGEVTWRPFPGVWGVRSLPIEFTPAPAEPDSRGPQ